MLKKDEFKFSDGGIIFLLAFLSPIAVGILLSVVSLFVPNFLQTDVGFWLTAFLSETAMFFAVYLYCTFGNVEFKNATRWKTKLHPLQYVVLVLLSLALLLPMLPLQTYFSQFLENMGVLPPESYMPPFEGNFVNLLLGILFVGALTAVCEETVFRGAVLNDSRSIGGFGAIVLSGSLFALIHTNPFQTLHPLVLGMLFGWVAYVTESMLASVTLHFCNNCWVLLISYFGETAILKFTMQNAVWLIPVGVVLTAALLFLFWLVTKKYQKREPVTDDSERVNALFRPTADKRKDLRKGICFYVPAALACLVLWIKVLQGGI